MRIKKHFCRNRLPDFVGALLIVCILIKFSEFSGCYYIPDKEVQTSEYEISVTDKPYDFVNAENLPENNNTVYKYKPELKATDEKRIFYGAGTCSFLKGKKIVALFFIDDIESMWNEKSIQNFTDKSVLPALAFLEKEAELFGIDLDFEVWRFSSKFSEDLNLKYNGRVNPDLFDGGSTKDLMVQTADIFGYSCDMALRWALMEKSDGTEIIPMFVLNKDGTSYARNNYVVEPVTAAEHAILFSGNKYLFHNKASTFAHELLHLYGAEDLYTPTQRYNLAVDLYPNDIMCLETRRMDKLKIEGFTAFTLGWTYTMPNICNNPYWYTSSSYENYREWFGLE